MRKVFRFGFLSSMFLLIMGSMVFAADPGGRTLTLSPMEWSDETWFLIAAILYGVASEIIGANSKWKANTVVQAIMNGLAPIFKKENKQLGMILIIGLSFVGLTHCATIDAVSTVDQQVIAYEEAGTILSTTGLYLKMDCEAGVIDKEKCVMIRDLYNKTRIAYQDAGDAQIARLRAITPEGLIDARLKERTAMIRLTTLIGELQQIQK